MKNIRNIVSALLLLIPGWLLISCSLDEVNPGGVTLEAFSTSKEGYETLINQCFFGMERCMFGTQRGDSKWMQLSEANSDLWTYTGNRPTAYYPLFWFYRDVAPDKDYTLEYWRCTYDGISSCNIAISLVDNVPFDTEEERNAKVAVAHFMRGMYYYYAVEQFGALVKVTEAKNVADYYPVRTEPLEIYRDVILPDLEFAAKWLPVGDDNLTTTPSRKSAMGLLAKAYLSTHYYGTDEYVDDALRICNELIRDCEGGGTNYNTYMYTDYADVFKEANNWANKEALWKHRWNANGSSNGNYVLNKNDEMFLCNVYQFGAFVQHYTHTMTWEFDAPGPFMPTHHLLNLFVQEDGTLDPRFHTIFTTEWIANTDYTWSVDAAANNKKDPSVEGLSVKSGELGMRFVMPQDPDYAEAVAEKKTVPYVLVDYADVYDDASREAVGYLDDGSVNFLSRYYPSLNKHNSSNYFVANASKGRIGNLNGVLIMRMAEIYLLAAEASVYAGDGNAAMGYINSVRRRAGANELTGSATIRTVLDERGRELCGEGVRYYDLKRTGMFKDASYLQQTHPDLAQYFKPEYALRPIPTGYLDMIANGTDPAMQNPGY